MINSKSAVTFALLFLIPATLYVLAIVAYPLVDTINLSFTNAGLPRTYNFVGWANSLDRRSHCMPERGHPLPVWIVGIPASFDATFEQAAFNDLFSSKNPGSIADGDS